MRSLRKGREGFGKEVYKACELGRLPRGHVSLLNASKRSGLGSVLQSMHGQHKGDEPGFLSVFTDKPMAEPRMGKGRKIESSKYQAAIIDSEDFLNGDSGIRSKLIPGGRLVVIASIEDAEQVRDKLKSGYSPVKIEHADPDSNQVLVVGDKL